MRSFFHLLLLSGVVAGAEPATSPVTNRAPLREIPYHTLLLGSVKTEGWLKGPNDLKGFIPLAGQLKDEELMERAETWVDAIWEIQGGNGFYASSTNDDWWPRMVVNNLLRVVAKGQVILVSVNDMENPVIEAEDDRYVSGVIGVRRYSSDHQKNQATFDPIKAKSL